MRAIGWWRTGAQAGANLVLLALSLLAGEWQRRRDTAAVRPRR